MNAWLAVLLFLGTQTGDAQAAALTAEEIIRNSVQANQRDWQAEPKYSYMQTTRTSTGTKTSQVIMLFGTPYERVLKVNEKPLSQDQQKREEEKFRKALESRRTESPSARSVRLSKYEKDRRRDRLMMSQLTSGFDFKLNGEKSLSGLAVYNLLATPKPGYQPPNMEARVLKGMRGELWIDQKSFQWVKVRAEVISPVTIGGILATVQPGTFFELEKMPVDGDIWLPKHFSVRSRSKVLMLFHHATDEDDTYFDYKKTPSNIYFRLRTTMVLA